MSQKCFTAKVIQDVPVGTSVWGLLLALLRKPLAPATILSFCIGITLADEFRGVITQFRDGRVLAGNKGKGEMDAEGTLPVADNVKVLKGKFNQDTKQLEDLQPIDQGLKNQMLSNIWEKGFQATVITDADNKITEIRVGGRSGKKQQ